MIDNNIKLELCIKHKEILDIIGVINKGYILQKQLIEYILKLEIAPTEYGARKIITDLEEGEIIKKISFLDTNNQIILLKKFGIRFIKGKNDSQSVGAIRTCTTNRRYYKSILLNHYILKKLEDKNVLEFAKKNGIVKLFKCLNSNIGVPNMYIYNNFKESNRNYYTLLKEDEDKKIKSIEKATNTKKAKKDGKIIEKVKVKKATKSETREKLRTNATLDLLQKNNTFLFNLSAKRAIFAVVDADYNLTENKLLDILIGIYYLTSGLLGDIQIIINIVVWENDDIKRIKKEKVLDEFKKVTQATNKNVLINFKSADMKKNYMGNKLKVAD